MCAILRNHHQLPFSRKYTVEVTCEAKVFVVCCCILIWAPYLIKKEYFTDIQFVIRMNLINLKPCDSLLYGLLKNGASSAKFLAKSLLSK